MVEDGHAGGCSWEIIEGDNSGFNLLHSVAVRDTNVDAVGNRLSVPDAGLFTGIVVAGCRVQFPWCFEVAGVVSEAAVRVWSGDHLQRGGGWNGCRGTVATDCYPAIWRGETATWFQTSALAVQWSGEKR